MVKQKLLTWLFLLMILKVEISTGDSSRVNCVMDKTKCTVSNLIVTSKNYTFVPVAPHSITVTKFEMVKSIVSVLTSNICTTFTKLNSFTAVDQHIESLEDYAFNNCTEITYINLEKNNIHELGQGTFSNTKKLQELYILGGLLEYIDGDLFSNLGELKVLLFGANGLKELPVTAVKNLRKLENLHLYSNDLSDLDAKGLVENLVSLKEIYINDNNFHCTRLGDMLEVFKARNILYPDKTYFKYIKKRDYIPRKDGQIICLTEAQLKLETLKKGLTASLDELKDQPLGKEIIQLQAIVKDGFINTDSVVQNLSDKYSGTVDNLTSKMTILNATFKNALTELNDNASKLKQEMFAKQQILIDRLNNTNLRLRKLNESFINTDTRVQNLTDKHSKTVDNLTSKMMNLNATFKNTLTKVNDNVSKLKQEMLAKQQILIDRLSNTTLRLQELNESYTILMNATSSSGKSNKSRNVNMFLYWVCLAILLLVIVAMGFCVIKKSRKVAEDVPLICYEDRVASRQAENFNHKMF